MPISSSSKYGSDTLRSEESDSRIGVSCLKRFPAYLHLLRELQAEGRDYVSGTVLASVHSLESVVVRKDLASTGIVGTPKIGFPVNDLIAAIEKHLGWDHETKAILVGTGNLGTALLGYRGFDHFGLRIVAGFDVDPNKIGTHVHGFRIQSMSKLVNFVQKTKVQLGVVTVSSDAAQSVVDLMVSCGIRGIWHFTSAKVKVPSGVVVQKEDLAEGLAVISHRLRHVMNSDRERG